MSSTITATALEQHEQTQGPLGTDNLESEPTFGAQVTHRLDQTSIPNRRMSVESFDLATPATGAQTPDLLFREHHDLRRGDDHDQPDLAIELEWKATHKSTPHMGIAMENLARSSMSNPISNAKRDPLTP